ncbi:glycosyltransferase family 4 protein [Roseibium sp.]|uniref:glycosyltransferase family 4 protein n=1 Tax=Roseibium sp. TaxID=1936156 RepID=UPI003A97E84D
MIDARHIVFAYPGDLQTPTGGYAYDRRIMAGLQVSGWEVEPLALGEGFPFPDEDTLCRVQQRLELVPNGRTLVIDGLAFGVMDPVFSATGNRWRFVALVHHPLCKENGLSHSTARILENSEHRALAYADRVIVTSKATADQVAGLFAVPRDKIHVVVPGTDQMSPPEALTGAQGTKTQGEVVRLLSVGTIVPRKGYDLLFAALSGLAHMPWHLDIIGDTSRDSACFQNLVSQLASLGLSERVTFHGAVAEPDLSEHYASADIFVLASRYEGYGMAYTEALAHGIPVIGSGEGAVRETLGGGGALYCPTNDVAALKDALGQLIARPNVREHLRQEAMIRSREFPTWDQAVRQFAKVLEGGR